MKNIGYGEGYRYPHDETNGFASGVRYLPDQVRGEPFYEPSERGNEKTIKERLAWLRDQVARKQAG
jgi:putative ATPase